MKFNDIKVTVCPSLTFPDRWEVTASLRIGCVQMVSKQVNEEYGGDPLKEATALVRARIVEAVFKDVREKAHKAHDKFYDLMQAGSHSASSMDAFQALGQCIVALRNYGDDLIRPPEGAPGPVVVQAEWLAAQNMPIPKGA